MKRLLYFLVFLFTLLSCSIDHEKARRMQYELQRVQEMNKAFVPLDTVTVMDTVLDYYESHGNNAEKMMANYMMGCVHRDRGNSPVALEYYRKATEYADTTNLSEVRTLSRIYGQIAEVFNRQRAPQLELKAEREAIRLSLKAKDSLAAVMYYEYLSGPYHMMDKMDSALLINQTAIAEFMKMGRMDLAAGVLPTAINIYLSQKKYKEAKLAMEQFEQYSGWFTGDGIAAGHEFYYYYKGLYYEGVERSDSALYYYRKLLHFSQMENLQAAYEGLARTYKEIGQADSAIKYAFLFAQANDSISLKSSSQEIVKMQALYDYNENQRIAAEKEKEAENLRTFLYMIIIAVCLGAYLIYKYTQWQKKKKLDEITKVNSKYTEILSQYSKSLSELNSLKGGFDKYQTDKQKEIENLKLMLSVYQSDNTSPEKWNIEQALLDSRIIHHLHQSANKAQMATSAEWNDLKDTVSEHLPDFYEKIATHKDLTDKEVLVCMLSKLRFIPSEMVVLLGSTSQRITNIRSSLNMKLFQEKGAQGLEANLRRF
ncbi:MAG: hypothetical protein J6I37_08820 [Prevotella sp.]|nr:hypothetical protein [Prevotella sp.]